MWCPAALTDVAAGAIEGEEARRREEHAAHGPDALPELRLHALLADAFRSAGFTALREHPYPSLAAGAASVRDSERVRCDLVLLPEPGATLVDPVIGERTRLREQAALEESLFRDVLLPEDSEPDPGAADLTPEEAFWLEVKTVGQFAYVDGVPVPNARYGSLLVGGIREDLRKLQRDPRIRFGGVLMVLFAAEEGGARHDLAEAVSRAADLGVTVTEPVSRAVPIADRAGNGICLVSLIRRRSG